MERPPPPSASVARPASCAYSRDCSPRSERRSAQVRARPHDKCETVPPPLPVSFETRIRYDHGNAENSAGGVQVSPQPAAPSRGAVHAIVASYAKIEQRIQPWRERAPFLAQNLYMQRPVLPARRRTSVTLMFRTNNEGREGANCRAMLRAALRPDYVFCKPLEKMMR